MITSGTICIVLYSGTTIYDIQYDIYYSCKMSWKVKNIDVRNLK